MFLFRGREENKTEENVTDYRLLIKIELNCE